MTAVCGERSLQLQGRTLTGAALGHAPLPGGYR